MFGMPPTPILAKHFDFTPNHPLTFDPAAMNRTTLAIALTVGIALVLAGLWSFQSQEGLDPLADKVQTHTPAESAPDVTGLKAIDSGGPKRVIAETDKPEQAMPGSLVEASLKSDTEAKTGVIFGNILLSDGSRFDRGRVLVFANGERETPLKELELTGYAMEYRCELPAGRAYQLIVDPHSLLGDYTPPLIRSLHRKRLGQTESVDPKDLRNFSFAYVSLVEGTEHRQDLRVGLPAEVAGRLLAADGAPMSGVNARISGLNSRVAGFSEDSITAAEGRFEFKGVYPGDYRLTFFRAEAWNPPAPLDITILDGESRWLGEIRVEGAGRTIGGTVLDQDGLPFPGLAILCFSNAPVKEGVARHNFSSALGRAVTGADGSFVLDGLPNLPVKVSLTPKFEPNLVRGPGHPAMWEPSIEVDLSRGSGHRDLGTHTVHESRPYTLSGTLVFDEAWLASRGGKRRGLRATVSQIKGGTLPEGIRRVSLRRQAVTFDFDAGTFQCEVETPMTEVEVRFKLKGYDDLVVKLQPEALGSWSREIRVPADF